MDRAAARRVARRIPESEKDLIAAQVLALVRGIAAEVRSQPPDPILPGPDPVEVALR